MDYLCGAEVTFIPENEWSGHAGYAAHLQDSYASNGDRALFIPIGASDEVGLWGYIAACEELKEDFAQHGLTPDYLVTATGSGGTQAGLIVGSQLFDLPAEVRAFNVSDSASYFDRKIREDVLLWKQRYNMEIDEKALDIQTVEGYLGEAYGVAGPEIFDLIAELGRTKVCCSTRYTRVKPSTAWCQSLRKARLAACPARHRLYLCIPAGCSACFRNSMASRAMRGTPVTERASRYPQSAGQSGSSGPFCCTETGIMPVSASSTDWRRGMI